MNKKSSITPFVIKYLEEDCLLLPQQNYVIEEHTTRLSLQGETLTGLAVTVYFRAEHNNLRYGLCGWGEQFEGKEGLVFCCQNGPIPKDEAVKLIVERISSRSQIKCHLESPFFFERKKNKELREENDLLLEKIERLRQKKRELKYAPGNKGALKAQRHFETFQEK